MTILQLSGVKNWGGGEYHIENLCSELAITNPEVKTLVLCVKDAPFHKRLQKTSIEHITAPLKIKVDLRYVFKIITVCRKYKVDLIHIHDPSALQLAIIADKLYKLPNFIFSKKTSFPIKQRKKTLYKYNYPKIKKILCVSRETQNVASKAITDTSKLTTVYHGTNLRTKSTVTDFKIRNKYNITTNTLIVGHIGNHIRAKHLETFIKVIDIVVNKNNVTDVVFVQIGTFSDRTEALQNEVKRLNLEKYIIFMGYTPNASNFIPQFDIALMTSQSEGLPQFIYESMYHQVPIVTTDVGGIPELITHNENGLLAKMHDAETLSKHVLKLKVAPNLRTEFVEKGKAKLLETFTTSYMAQQTLKIYQNLM